MTPRVVFHRTGWNLQETTPVQFWLCSAFPLRNGEHALSCGQPMAYEQLMCSSHAEANYLTGKAVLV